MKCSTRVALGIAQASLLVFCLKATIAGATTISALTFHLQYADNLISEINVDQSSTQQDTLQNKKSNEPNLDALYTQAQKQAADGNLEMAITAFDDLLKLSPNYKDAKARLQVVREQLDERQLADRLESEYAIGLALLKAHDWTRAVITFENVLEMDRNFRDARRRLAEAKRGLEKESSEIITARYYADGIASMNQNDLGRALAAFEKVKSINPNYRNVASLIDEIENIVGQKARAVSLAGIDSLYHIGVAAQEKKEWLNGVVAFEKVQVLQPNYRDVAERLSLLRIHLTQSSAYPTVSANDLWSSPLSLGTAMVGLVVIPLLGLVVLSPSARARYHLLRGRYADAVNIYERLLVRKPDRIKLYPALANLYLLMGRHDERAMKVYKMVLQLNLTTTNREEINANVAQHYLSEGRTDSDAIEVLENLLKTEQRKQTRMESTISSKN